MDSSLLESAATGTLLHPTANGDTEAAAKRSAFQVSLENFCPTSKCLFTRRRGGRRERV
jgi:hypothetical protein